MEVQLRAALASFLGPDKPLPARPVKVVPSGDHYDVATIPPNPKTPRVTATATPGENGRWSIDNVRFTAPARIDAPPFRRGWGLSIAEQFGQAEFDPSGATELTFDHVLQDFDLHGANGYDKFIMVHFNQYESHMSLAPSVDGRSDVVRTDQMAGLRVFVRNLAVEAERLRIRLTMPGASGGMLLDLFHRLAALDERPSDGPLTPAAADTLVEAIARSANGLTLNVDVDDAVYFERNEGALMRRAAAGLTVGTDGQNLVMAVSLDAGGLVLPELDADGSIDFIPELVSIHLTVSNLRQDLAARFLKLAFSNTDPTQAEFEEFYAQHVEVSFDSIEIGDHGARITGSGKGILTGPLQGEAQASLVAENLDAVLPALMATLGRDERTATLMIKGLGRPDGARLIYDVTFNNGHLLVNGQDLFALVGR